MREPEGAVLLSRLSLTRILYRRWVRRRQATYYFDAFGLQHGPLALVLLRGAGRRRVSNAVERCFAWLGIDMRRLPHQDGVAAYHDVQLRALNIVTGLLDEYGRRGIHRDLHIPAALDAECRDSLEVKLLGNRLWRVVENVVVVRALTGSAPVIWIGRDEYPDSAVRLIEERLGLTIERERRPDRLINLSVMAALAMVAVSALFWRSVKRRQHRGESRGYVAAELYDPDVDPGTATHPLYACNPRVARGRLVMYVTREQRRWVPRLWQKAARFGNVHDVTSLPIAASLAASALGEWARLVRDAATQYRSFEAFRQAAAVLHKTVDLTALFSTGNIAVHVYHVFPNGRASTRLDSGLVTGLCRLHGVRSWTYQSRSTYSCSWESCFDVFDDAAFWGELWPSTSGLRFRSRTTHIIGCVLPRHDRPGDRHRAPERRLVLFPGDVETDTPTHYTLEYNIEFIRICILGAAAARADGHSEWAVYVKTKDPDDVDLLATAADLRRVIAETDVPVEFIRRERHRTTEAIDIADAVAAIGFTTPGIEAMMRGIPARYVTQLDPALYIYPAKSPLVLRSVAEVAEFLCGSQRAPAEALDQLDPFRDGAAQVRLQHLIANSVEAA